MGEIRKVPDDVRIADPDMIDDMSESLVDISRKMGKATESMLGLQETMEDVHKKNEEYLKQRSLTMKMMRRLTTEL